VNTSYPAIADYALIGDCRSAALVSRHGSIDWLCWPRFDSPSLFGALLDAEKGGHFSVQPQGAFTATRRYLDDTNVLETTFHCRGGTVRLVDFMPVTSELDKRERLWPAHQILRIVECLEGEVGIQVHCAPRPQHASVVPRLRDRGPLGFYFEHRGRALILRSEIPLALSADADAATARCVLRQGERRRLSVVYSDGEPAFIPPLGDEAEYRLEATCRWWQDWAARCRYHGPYRQAVLRSALTLKLMCYAPSGAVVAAPTTSLPEWIGGVRNWDYRYCWLRDSSFILLALMNAGFRHEAGAFRDWVKRAVAGTPDQLQALYGVGGERRLQEWVADWLPGYEGSAPVRIGNAAACQFQLDVYGELIALFEVARMRGMKVGRDGSQLERAFLQELEARWQEPDEGIWEVRSERRHFTHSKLMAWLAFHLASQNDQSGFSQEDRQRWQVQAEQVHAQILQRGLHADGYFVQSYDSDALDAALLLMPLVGFLPADDPRIVATVEAIQAQLTVDGLVQRYHTHDHADGLPPGEGTFLACSFWLVEALVMIGRTEQATALYDTLQALCNDVGLLAEEYDPRSKRMLGNFPQGYSHVALVNAAYRLNDAHNAKRTSAEVHA
jgi:GH15 family glucan-1,4-alpha-glucosidase